MLGSSSVAETFLLSPEYRSGAVRTFYGDPMLAVLPYQPFFPEFFHRTPSASELAAWVQLPQSLITGYLNPQLALLGIEQQFAASDEFFVDNS